MEENTLRPILIVEDDAPTRDLLRLFLENEGFEVAVAGDGRGALEHLRKRGLPCVILLDLSMPGMDGWQFMDTLARHPTWIGVPVVLLTGADGVAREDALAMGADELLHKPVDPEILTDVMDRYC
jgi:CheY-like chemotaxis protein